MGRKIYLLWLVWGFVFSSFYILAFTMDHPKLTDDDKFWLNVGTVAPLLIFIAIAWAVRAFKWVAIRLWCTASVQGVVQGVESQIAREASLEQIRRQVDEPLNR